jgi:subtilisin family serine protease
MSARRRSLRGHLVLRLREGRELAHISTHRDVRTGIAPPAAAVDRGGRIDRALRRHSAGVLVTRAFYARAGIGRPGAGHVGWDDVERQLGLSRTLRIQIDPYAPVSPLVSELLALDDVEMATPEYLASPPGDAPGVDPRAHLHDPVSDDGRDFDERAPDAARALINADAATRLEPGDSSLIIGLIDSGVNLEHPELRGRLRPGVASVAITQDSLEPDLTIVSGTRSGLQDVDDDQGHGTTCASLLCANGFRMQRGLAGAARLLPVRALCGARVEGQRRVTAIGTIQDIDSGLKTAIDLGARILNLSFGTPESALEPGAPAPHVEVVRYALARDCVLVAAAGNSGKDERYFPAALPGVIAVGAVDARGEPAPFTTRGEHVALSAPGAFVRAARLEGYAAVSGTSFAAPLVTAACALLVARGARHSLPLPPALLRELLVSSASRFPVAGTRGLGAGVLDILAALRRVDDWARRLPEVA